MGKRDSPNRRKSIAVHQQNKPAFIARTKRRAHSIVPGDHLSPLARARRSLGPRKSILKGSALNFNGNGSQPSSQSTTAIQPFTPDDTNATQSMDLTTDIQYQQDNTTRLSRRVSFAGHCTVRFFQPRNNDNTNSTGTPPSSPTPPPETSSQAPQINDENDYPGARRNSRRSSLRYSIARSEDMDLTSELGHNVEQGDSAIGDEAGGSMDDMEDAIDMALSRRRSSIAVGPSSQLQDDEDLSRSEEAYTSEAEQSGDQDLMEFTIPINHALRPAHQDEAWLALQRVTHSASETPDEPDEEAESSVQSNPADYNVQEDSYNDDDSSHDLNDENQTINITKMLGWPGRIEEDISRLSIGGESNMEESEVYGLAAVPPTRTTLRPSATPLLKPSLPTPECDRQESPRQEDPTHITPRRSVFQPPPDNEATSTHPEPIDNQRKQELFPLQTPRPFTFTAPKPTSAARPSSPSKIPVFKSTYTAAFAPPVSKPTPKRPIADATPSISSSSSKRPRSVEDDGSIGETNMSVDAPSPSKRQSMASKWPGSTPTGASISPPSSASLPKPRPLSPSKKAPFQQISASASHSTNSLRRPSGYLARRKSLAVGPASQLNNRPEQRDATNNQTSATTKAGLGFRRASVGTGPADAWKRFDKSLTAQAFGPGSQSSIQKEASRDVLSTPPRRPASPTSVPAAQLALRLASPSPGLSHTTTEVDPQVIAAAVSPARRISVDLNNILLSTVDEEGDEEAELSVVQNANQNNETMQVAAEAPGDEGPPLMSINQFLDLTSIKFMDELTAPRRSTHPSHNRATRQAREENEIKLAEYFEAMAIDVPQLQLYTRVAMDLEAWIEQSRSVYAQAEVEAAKMTPELFTEYARADEEGRAELLHQLNLIRTNVRAQAKSDWYDWKLQWVQGLKETADKAFNALEEDAKKLEEIKARADEVVPELEREYENVMRELEQEMAEVAEIEASDQDHLNELKSAIAEQNIEVEALRAEVAEGNSHVERLQERLEEIEAHKREASTTIESAKRILHVQKSSTKIEVLKLKDELESLEELHMFRATKIAPELFRYIYNSQFQVTIPCVNFVPIITQVEVSRVENSQVRARDLFPELSNFFLEMAQRQIVEGDDQTLKQIVHRLGDYWASCTQLRSQLKFLSIKYPVDIEIIRPTAEDGLPGFKAHTTVLFPVQKAKATVTFVFSTATFCYWPITLDSLDCEVEVNYGPVDRANILKCIIDRLSQATPSNNHACLMDACIEAQETYSNLIG